MSRALTPKTSLENLRKEAKRWLGAVRSGDAAARARLNTAWPGAPSEPGLRDVQHALAREYGQESWIALKAALDDLALLKKSRDEQLEVVLRNGWGGDLVAARRILDRNPDLARSSLFAAAACGDLGEVERRLARDPQAAKKTGGPLNWTALAYATYGRLDEVNGLAIARRLLEAGADPNFQFDDGWGSPFRIVTGAIGLGEGAKPPHPQAMALVELLVEAGAGPFDPQALYNISIVGDDTHWYDVLWRLSEARGVLDHWRRPAPGLGDAKGLKPLDYLLGNAVGQNHLERAAWLLDRGADPDAVSLYKERSMLVMAQLAGFLDMAALLQRHGARAQPMSPLHAFQAACMAGDRAQAGALLAADPSLTDHPEPLLSAAELGNERAVDILLSLGAPVNALGEAGISPLHRAVQSGSVKMVAQMVAAGAEIDLREKRWHGTPMSWAVVLNKPAVADYLAPLSFDPRPMVFGVRLERLEEVLRAQPWRVREALPGDGPTPLFCLPDDEPAAAEATRILLAHGADPSFRNAKGQTPVEQARLRGLDDAAELMDEALEANQRG